MPSDADPENLPEGLIETRFGIAYRVPSIRALFEVVDLRRKNGELWGELTVRCKMKGVRGQLDGDRLRQGAFNFHSITTRTSWAKALDAVSTEQMVKDAIWHQSMERVCQAVLDYDRNGSIHGGFLAPHRIEGGRPWAAWPIIPHHETSTLFSRGGSGKTTLALTLCVSMGLGWSLVPGIRVDRPYRIAYLDWETQQDTPEDLLGLLAESYKVDIPTTIWYEPMDAPLERSLAKIATIIERSHADMLIIDSVGMALLSSGDYSDPAESIVRAYQTMRRLGTWGLLIDHVRSDDVRSKRPAVKAYGSVYKTNLARHGVALHVGDKTETTAEAYLVCPKSNVMRDRWAMSGTYERSDDQIRWAFHAPDYDLFESLMAGDDEEPEQDAQERATPRRQSAILHLLLDASPRALTAGQIGQALSITAGNARMILGRIGKDGLVMSPQTEGREKLWVITQEGINLLTGSPVDRVTGEGQDPDLGLGR